MSWPRVYMAINVFAGKDGSRAELLDKFIGSIWSNTSYENYELVIYDDASPKPFVEDVYNKYKNDLPIKLKKFEKPVQQIHLIRNKIFTDALDTNSKYILALDDDLVVTKKNWLKHMISCMENIPQIGILSPHWARLEDGQTRQKQHAPFGVLQNNDFAVYQVQAAAGNCWLIRREVLETLGMYPEHFTHLKFNSDGTYEVVEDRDLAHFHPGSAGSDTWYGYHMLSHTHWELCLTLDDLLWHTGQEYMKKKSALKTFNEEERPY